MRIGLSFYFIFNFFIVIFVGDVSCELFTNSQASHIGRYIYRDTLFQPMHNEHQAEQSLSIYLFSLIPSKISSPEQH